MRAQLESYDTKALVVTLVPWALEEPAEPVPISEHERSNVFGTASLGLMYSGSYGRAHTCSDLLTLSRSLLLSDAVLAFSVRGNRVEELKRSIALGDSNIRLVPFATPDKLQERLSAADIHLVSLRDEWTGMVVPSKFFGALAIGRPVLFFGSRKSSVAELIEKHRIGWVWDPENTSRNICGLASDPQQMAALSRHCHAVYRAHFSRDRILNKWDQHLRQILEVMPPN
jgi:glycosyltransferase involved in cell wall biosynthesis